MTKRALSFLLVLAMVIGSMPTMAYAASSSATVYVGGYELTVSNNRAYATTDSSGNVTAGTSGNYTVRLDCTTDVPILTLRNATIAATGAGGDTAEYFSGIHSSSDLIIELVGANTVTGAELSGSAYGIQAPGKRLIICGGGSLRVSSHNAATPTNGYGIMADTIHIESGTLSVDGDGNAAGQGLSATQININGGYVTITGSHQAVSAAPMLGADVTVTAASVNTSGSGAVTYNSADIATYRYLKVDDLPAPEGSGTEDDPYQLGTADDLKWFARQVNARQYTLCARLTADITINSKVLEADGSLIADPSGLVVWTPIGGFKGVFDGQGHTISGLYYRDSSVDHVGLFSSAERATIKNLGVLDSYFEGKQYVAGICAELDETTVEGCWSAATILCKFNGGGICGTAWQSSYTGSRKTLLNNCYNLGKITQTGSASSRTVGGVVGYMGDGKMTNCHHYGSAIISGTTDERGIFGTWNASVGTLKNVYALHDTKDTDSWAVASRFASGEICYLLNNQGDSDAQLETPVWYQTIGTDPYPVLDSTHGTVYRGGSEGSYTYSNTVPHSHDMSVACGDDDEIDFVELKVGELPDGENDGLTYKALPTGNYYLSGDVDLGAITVNAYGTNYQCSGLYIPDGATVNLCLNGHELKGPGQEGWWGNIAVAATATLNICDCRPTATTHTITDPVSGGTKTIKGGLITGVNSTDARKVGINIYVNGTLKMYGGTIAGNKVSRYGAGVCVEETGTFEMHGGTITYNAIIPDGVYSGHGAGVEARNDIVVSGAARITGNAVGTTPNNVYLYNGKTIRVASALTCADGSIGVSTGTVPASGSPVTVSSDGGGYAVKFASDNSDFAVAANGSALVLQIPVIHKHDVSVACSHDADVTFTRWDTDNALPTTAGHYYLDTDVTLRGLWTPVNGVTDICLNGHTITTVAASSNGQYDTFEMANSGAILSICDCQTTQGIITVGSGNTLGLVEIFGATLNLYGGKLTGSNAGAIDAYGLLAGGVMINDNGVFNMYGGEISGNTGYYAGGVSVYNGTFNMYGGTITDNTVTGDDENGGGVAVFPGGTMTVSGTARITGNKKGTAANNLYLPGGKVINISTPLTTGANIGVTVQSWPETGTKQIANDADSADNTGSTYFTADDSDYEVVEDAEGTISVKKTAPTQDRTAIRLIVEKTKTRYAVGDTLSADDVTVTVLYSDDTTEPATGWHSNIGELSSAAAGIQTLRVTWGSLEATLDLTIESDEDIYYTVHFDPRGGTAVPDRSVKAGGKLALPDDPTRPGHRFTGWYSDAGCKTAFNANTAITGDLTLYAQWTPNQYTVTLDANGGVLKGKTELEVTFGKNYTGLVNPTRAKEGDTEYNFDGWYTEEEGGVRVTTADAVTIAENHTLYAHWSEITVPTVAEVDDSVPLIYDGKAKTPALTVRGVNGALLTEGKDYTVKYTNNTAANWILTEEEGGNGIDTWKTPKKKPTATITGKGNYTGKITVNFEIQPYVLDLDNDPALSVTAVFVAYNGKVQKGSPVVKLNGKTLKKGTDYTLVYPHTDKKKTDPDDPDVYEPDAFKAADTYTIQIVGKGNYAGTISVKEIIIPETQTLMSKVKVAAIPAQTYTGDKIEPELKVTFGSGKNTVTLERDVHYRADFTYNTEVGTATVTLTGIPENGFVGVVTKTFKITGTALKAKDVTLTAPASNKYDPADPDSARPAVKVTAKDPATGLTVELTPDEDYTIAWPETKKGSNKVTVRGIGAYTGAVTKSFTVAAYAVKQDDENVVVILPSESLPYAKGGAKFDPAEITVKVSGKALTLGTDYTVSFANNAAVNEKTGETWTNAKKIPAVKITFKGNYSGSKTANFAITQQVLADAVSIKASDIACVGTSKPGKYATTVTLTDADGKALKANTDYTVAYSRGGEPLDKTSTVSVGDVITVTATAKEGGNYAGSISATFTVKPAVMASAKISLAAGVKKYYTGEAVELAEDELVVKIGNKKLVRGTDYELVDYKNNEKVGTATVTVTGLGNYGGSKTFTFRINARKMSPAEAVMALLRGALE